MRVREARVGQEQCCAGVGVVKGNTRNKVPRWPGLLLRRRARGGKQRLLRQTHIERDIHISSVVATARRLLSDSGAFADWAASSAGRAAPTDELSLGFNAGPAAAAAEGSATGPASGMWSGAASRSFNYGLSQEMGGMLGLRDFYVVAPASSFHHHHHHHHHHDQSVMTDPHSVNSSNPATALGVGVIPLLSATPCLGQANVSAENNETTLMSNRSRGGAIQLWQDQEPEHGHYLKKQGTTMFELNDSSGNLIQNENGLTVSATNSGGTTCQDCGNQAKKDCSYRRCRTCCKSRNYDCPTHVKSTWVPESRRRERRLMAAASAATAGGSTGATSGAKKPKLVTSQQQTTTNSHTSTSNNTPPRSFDTSSSHQDAGFKESLPGQVRVPAVFKCVRVTAVDDGQDEIAYQATVKICGHVFKGFLYDQGVESRDVYPNLSELHLGGGGGGGGGNGASSSSPMLDPSDVYVASGGGLLGGGGSTYGNPIN
ncbi:protein LATERAL ROOT PRIMORDIUM 1-like [Neltuma alba]|uniref:protein LATERAL ROOT PRIMORDIUM 1-like n=1 Tax=Neltuma alba TaxID=207710 RepID=UPI0010A2ABB9|nr:protein LATERAL ROOT PRIMORDIUM 1-like [Prosopis alba]